MPGGGGADPATATTTTVDLKPTSNADGTTSPTTSTTASSTGEGSAATSSTTSTAGSAASTTTSTSERSRPEDTRPEGGTPKSGTPSAAQRQEVVELVNERRARSGCPPVRADDRLDTAAQRHSDDMAERDYLDHTSPEGTTFDERIENAGYSRPAAENIAMGMSSADAVMNAWMDSDGHRRNILNCEITTIGVGVNTSGWYWTQTFGY